MLSFFTLDFLTYRQQTKLLRCRWATLDVLIAAQERWLSSNGRRMHNCQREHKPINLDFADPSSGNDDTLQDFDFDSFLQPGFVSSSQAPSESELGEFDHEFAQLTASVQGYLDKRIVHRSGNHRIPRIRLNNRLRMHPATQIPESLLKGPWTSEMQKHLAFLVRADPRIDWIDTTDGETLSEGLHTAITTGDLLTLVILDSLELGQLIHEELVLTALRETKDNKALIVCQLLSMLDSGSHLGNLDRSKIRRSLAFEAYRQRKKSSERRMAWEELDDWLNLRAHLRSSTSHLV